jgi:DNA-binding winged helix-turn-helix (wHTH) protein/Flp pilus assembly protein TadD
MNPGPENHTVYRFGVFEANSQTGEFLRKGVRAKLQEQRFRLLQLLLENAGEIVSRESVRQRLWPGNTFVEFDASLSVAVGKLREALGDDADNPRFIETIPRRGYRFVAPVQQANQTPELAIASPAAFSSRLQSRRRTITIGIALTIVIGASVALVVYLKSHQQAALAQRDGIVVGDFSNSTGDSVFDGTLRRAVVVQLAQSPFFTIPPDTKLQETLQGLGRPPDEKLTPAVAREVCQQAGAKASVTGAISQQGAGYVIALEADRCADGNSLARQEVTAARKDQVLPSLGSAIQELRKKLGESKDSLGNYDVPIDQATTDSIEALKAYQLGLDLRARDNSSKSIPAFKTALTLDPNFAMAYAQLGSAYSNSGETIAGSQYFKRAFELRSRATEPERFYIAGRYFDIITGELEKASENYELWQQTYPDEWLAYNALANDANQMGRYETAIKAAKETVLLNPNHSFGYTNLALGLLGANRFDEAKGVCEEAVARRRDSGTIHISLYAMAFMEGDKKALQHQMDLASRNPDEPGMLYVEAEVAAAQGKIKDASRLFRQDIAELRAGGQSEGIANTLAYEALLNALIGRTAEARRMAAVSLRSGRGETVLGSDALAFALAGDAVQAKNIADEFNNSYPLATLNMDVFSPMIQTAIAELHRPTTEEVTEMMKPALPYEFGQEADLLPVYIRGQAYLMSHSGADAAREFQKMLDHLGVDPVSPYISLAYLGLARADNLMGEKTNSLKEYEHFFQLWKDADNNIPILQVSRREYLALSHSAGGTAGRHHTVRASLPTH